MEAASLALQAEMPRHDISVAAKLTAIGEIIGYHVS